MIKDLLILTLILTFLVSCEQKVEKVNIKSTLTTENNESDEKLNHNLKTIKLDFDFVVNVGQEEDFKKFKTYSYFKLTKNQSTIFIDSLLTEYEFGD